VKPYDILQVKNAFTQPVCYVTERTGPTFFKNYVMRFKSASEKTGSVLADTLCNESQATS